jgi:signal transduction histidine kinase
MENMSDDVLLKELNKRFTDTKKALHDMRIMNEKIEKLNAKLAESERLKTNFLSNIRNEINNPLTSILGMARELAGPVKDEKTGRMMAQMIYNEAFDLNFQLRNIFIAAELEAGETGVATEQTDIAALVQNIVRSFAHKAREKNVTVDISCATGKDGKLSFKTDPGKLSLMLENLVANAIEYNRPGKKVIIEAREDKKTLHVTVADEGIGIPDRDRERLFERFRQLDEGASKRYKGHGLGLCITKALTEMQGGRIAAAQAAGGGSVFTLTIPEGDVVSDAFSEAGGEFLPEGGSAF